MTNPEMNAVNKAPIDYIDALARIADLEASIARLVEALERIKEWKFPATGRFWDDDPSRPMSYSACYGSNGQRDYMRQIASQALSSHLQESAHVER